MDMKMALRLVAAEVEGAEDDRLPVEGVDNADILLVLLLLGRQHIPH